MTSESIRLNKHLAFILGISRREADEMIARGKVSVDGQPARLGQTITPSAAITVQGKPIGTTVQKQCILFHKPVGFVCSRKAQGDTPTIYSLLPSSLHALKPVGRLDKDSSGLLLLTNDGDLAHRMTHPSFHKVKIYEVTLDKALEPLHQQMISDYGVLLEDGKSQFIVAKLMATPARVVQRANVHTVIEPRVTSSGETSAAPIDHVAYTRDVGREAVSPDDGDAKANSYVVTMHEGRNRQIRRTFAALGYTVTRLHRVQFGEYQLHNLAAGKYRPHTLDSTAS